MSPSTPSGHSGAEEPSREARVTAAFIDLADTLAADFDPDDFLYRVAEHCMSLLDIDDAGVMLFAHAGPLRLAASTSEAVRLVELFELDASEGPCFTAFHTATPVDHPLAAAPTPRWPRFSARARRSGYTSVHAAPILLRGQTIGVLNLFRRTPGSLPEPDRALARALADATAISLLQQTTLDQHRAVHDQLQQALDTRVFIERAKGFLIARHRITPDAAFQQLRAYARRHRIRIADLARAVVEETVTLPPPPGNTDDART
ncbi:GAF domain-containing protein [Streptomyces sp. V3I8]|uniref:GAF and ANTAR domain-containing protein n=1 Tax=Streptomyces sp. V3I8 TaxID=3042279 RepID=UPI00277D7916|nr:GAF and ANTAR domain-containing protein [Streptomyces sp. V3I8]MDQ1041614.1 GAF domain-containing protein [Streptomyces sp. V3I8]